MVHFFGGFLYVLVPWMVRPNEAPGGDKCYTTGVSGDAFLFYL